AYGYIRRTEGADGEKVDVFLGDLAADTTLPVFVVDQTKADGRFDESKVMLGFPSESAARAAYLANYPPGWTGLGGVREMTQAQFKDWVRDPKATKQPAARAGIAFDQAHRLAQRFTKDWGPDAPPVVLVRDAAELRQAAGLPEGADIGPRAEGYWNGKTAFLN